MPLPKNNKLLPFARALRKEMTPQERKLWYLFLRKYPIKIYKQRIIDSFIADFYCHAARLVIEIDGSQHYTEEGALYDEQRTRVLSDLGLTVVRFSNNEVDTRFSFVCSTIEDMIEERIKGERNDQLCIIGENHELRFLNPFSETQQTPYILFRERGVFADKTEHQRGERAQGGCISREHEEFNKSVRTLTTDS